MLSVQQGGTWPVGAKVLLIPAQCMGHPSAGKIQRPGVEKIRVKSRGAVCVMKGGYKAGNPCLYGGNEMLLEGGLTWVRITLKREKCMKVSVSSGTANVKDEEGQYRV